jgi:hypothetical protein
MLVFVSQGVLIVLFTVLGLKIISRNRTRAHLALFLFYILLVFGFIFNIVFVLLGPTNNEVLLRTFYILSSFFIAFPFVFNLLFIVILLKLEYSMKKIVAVVLLYGGVCLSLYLIPNGILFSPTWVPTYSFTFFIVLYVYFTVFMTIPTIFYSFKMYRKFEAQNLKKRLRLYLIGFIIIIGAIYGGIYFITTTNQLFKSIYGVFALIFQITAGILIYYGLGREL